MSRSASDMLSYSQNQFDSSDSDSMEFLQAKRKKKNNTEDSNSEDDQSINGYADRQIINHCEICQNYIKKCFDIADASLINAPEKKSRHFKVQINLRNYTSNIDRDNLFDRITNDHPGIQCIVSLEVHEPKYMYRSSQIFKILLNTKYTFKTWTSQEIYIYIFHLLRSIVGEEQPFLDSNKPTDLELRPEIVLEKTNTLKEGVRWATIDFDPRFTNCFDPDTFSESFRVERWARQNVNEPFSLKMPFITSKNTNKSHAELMKYLYEHKNKNHKKFEIKPCMLGPFNDWREPVRRWWNDWCIKKYHPKKKQMLIIGEQSNTGKTMFVTQALFGGADPGNQIPSEAILIPERSGNIRSVSSFAWQRARPAYNSVIFCDEFEIGFYNTETLKLVLEGSSFNPQVKGGYTDNIQLQIPAIFISNTDIPDFDKSGKDMKPLKRRFKIVRIPKNTKTYKSSEHNPYIELYQQLKINQLLNETAKELEKAENAQNLLQLIEEEENIQSEQNQIVQEEQNNRLAREASQIIQENENIASNDNKIVEWVSKNQIDEQFNGLVNSSQIYNIVQNSINNDQNDETVGIDTSFLNDLNSCQTPDFIQTTPTTLLDQCNVQFDINQSEKKDSPVEKNQIENIVSSAEKDQKSSVEVNINENATINENEIHNLTTLGPTTATFEEPSNSNVNLIKEKHDEIEKIVADTMNNMIEKLEKEFQNL
jgi:hypothetical protein